MDIERARYEAERARRQYAAVEPENRLVARTLESAWEECLSRVARMEEEYARAQVSRPHPLTEEERGKIRALAADVPAIWRATTTSNSDRQAIVRQMIERVEITVLDDSENVKVRIRWAGGWETEEQTIRPVQGFAQLSKGNQLLRTIRDLHSRGRTPEEIAEQINSKGWRPPKRRDTYSTGMVKHLLRGLGLARRRQHEQLRPSDTAKRRRAEWTLLELAREIGMPEGTLYRWIRRGDLTARKAKNGVLLVHANKAEVERLRKRRARGHTWRGKRGPLDGN